MAGMAAMAGALKFSKKDDLWTAWAGLGASIEEEGGNHEGFFERDRADQDFRGIAMELHHE